MFMGSFAGHVVAAVRLRFAPRVVLRPCSLFGFDALKKAGCRLVARILRDELAGEGFLENGLAGGRQTVGISGSI